MHVPRTHRHSARHAEYRLMSAVCEQLRFALWLTSVCDTGMSVYISRSSTRVHSLLTARVGKPGQFP